MPRTTASATVDLQLAGGVVVEEEQRLRALHHDVIGAHGDEVDADGVVAAGVDRQAQLGTHAVGAGHQHRLPVAARQLHQRAEAADAGQHLAALRAPHQRLDALDELVAGVDVDAGIAIGDAGAFAHGTWRVCTSGAVRPGRYGIVHAARALARAIQTMPRPAQIQLARTGARARRCWRAACAVLPLRRRWAATPGRASTRSMSTGQSAAGGAGRHAPGAGARHRAARSRRRSGVRQPGRRCAQVRQGYDRGPRGERRCCSTPPRSSRRSSAAGRSVWDPVRPFTLVVLDRRRVTRRADAARAELEQAAEERGLPISLVPLAVDDAGGSPLGHRRTAADGAALRRRRDPGGPRRGCRGADSGAAVDAVHARARAQTLERRARRRHRRTRSICWRRRQAARLARTEAADARAIEGVASLADYASVERLLQSVSRACAAPASWPRSPAVVTFELTVRGGAAALEQRAGRLTRLAARRGGDAAAVLPLPAAGLRRGSSVSAPCVTCPISSALLRMALIWPVLASLHARPLLAGAGAVHRRRGLRRPRRLPRQALPLDLRARQVPRSARRQAAAGDGVHRVAPGSGWCRGG